MILHFKFYSVIQKSTILLCNKIHATADVLKINEAENLHVQQIPFFWLGLRALIIHLPV
jgi:hypothetical protein